ncbi:unnamed protein product [Lactuca saligna]|uniref:Uncharacterized protein n=1 Tax=Lactuca saligna TaxID=75948 RepID=A0AA35V8E3_LACSI|nr:unnamed protein product [Lactuca saligna]
MEWTKQQDILRDLCSGHCSYIQFAPCAPSYLYAKYFASTLWEIVCKEDPLSLETSTVIRKKLLQHGGARDPTQLLNDLVGDGITRSYQNQGHGGGSEPTHMLLLLLYLILFDSLSTRHFKEMEAHTIVILEVEPYTHTHRPYQQQSSILQCERDAYDSLLLIPREKEATMEEERRKEEEARIKLEEEYENHTSVIASTLCKSITTSSRLPPTASEEGIGYALAKEFLKAGDNVLICSRSRRDRPFLPLSSYEKSFHLGSREVIVMDREKDEELDVVTLCAQSLLYHLNQISYTVHQAAATAYGALCAVLCSLPIGSNGRQNHVILGNLVDRFIGWALPLFSNINVGDGTELAAEGLHEFLNVAEGLNAGDGTATKLSSRLCPTM